METEEEQVEKLKTWLKENGLSIVFGVVIGIGGIGGYNYWNHLQETAAANASDNFSRMIAALESGDQQGLQTAAENLITDHGKTDYALMAHLALARLHVQNGEFEQAESALQQVAGSAGEKPVAYIARTRLAAVEIQLGKYDQALATLALDYPPEFAARVDELKGDVYALQGNTSQAIDAYRRAQTATPPPANGEFLRQKIDDLGASS